MGDNNLKNISKIKIFLIIFVLIFTSFAGLVNANITSKNSQKDFKVDYNKAYTVAFNKLKFMNKDDEFKLTSHFTIDNEKNANLCHVFNLLPKGFIIISADYRVNPLIAYSFTSDNIAEHDDSFFIEILKKDVEKSIDYHSKDNGFSVEKEWNYLTNVLLELPTLNDFQQWPAEGTTVTEGWVTTTWKQGEPFKNMCPMDGDVRSIAGCPAVAMAQILNFHENIKNTRFTDEDDYYHNYENFFTIDDDYEEYDFPSFPILNTFLETLEQHYENDIDITDDDKAALTFACGVAAKQVYTSRVSGTFGVNQAYDAYQRFGFETSALLTSEDEDMYDRVIHNMKNAYPVHLALVDDSGTVGHNMVLDGYNTDDYYHINFGWSGQYDGWYKLPSWRIPYDLTVIEGLIVDIMNDGSEADLDFEGNINLAKIPAGSTHQTSFNIKNVGQEGSELDWEIIEWPDWGEWSFSIYSGVNLTPEEEPVEIELTITAPDVKNKEFKGGVKIVNKNMPGDICYVPVVIKTPKSFNFNLFFNSNIYDFFTNVILKYFQNPNF